jgi:Phytanoyl-CoA dioxygenase (PhyH)
MVDLLVRLEELTIGNEGAQLFPRVLSTTQLEDLGFAFSAQPRDQAGVRLSGIPELRPFLSPAGPVGQVPTSILGPECFPVRAILFDKSADQNWSLGWHQDRTIAVKQRIEVNGFGPWSIKSGMTHVEPPFDLLARMLTVRVHLDAVPVTNAPLLIAPGSHKRGRIRTADIPDVVHQCGVIPCLAETGDIWLYATPILHASDAAVEPLHRRVLQVDYAMGQLPGGLQWLGI